MTTTPPIPAEILEALEDAVLLADRSGRIGWASARAAEMFGYERRAIVGCQLPALLSWEERDLDGPADDGAGDRQRHLEGYRRDGTSFPASIRRHPLDGRDEVLVFVRDRSEISAARDRLRELSQAIETASSGIAIADRDLSIRHANPGLARILGLDRDQVVGRSLRSIFSAALGEHDFRDLQGLRSLHLESESLRGDGTSFPVDLRFDLVTDDDGSAVGVVAIVQDFTERKRTEEALRVSEERYALAVDGSNDGIWDWDLRASRIVFSDRWQRLIGLEPGEISSSPDEWFSRIHPEDLPQLTRRLHAHLAGDTDHFEDEHRIQHADGSYRWMLARGAAVWDENRRPCRIAGSQTDITDRKVHDPLTGLPNRALFLDRLERARARARRQEKGGFAVVFVDLDRFKTVNDSLGHPAGDLLLIQVARRIEACLRAGDTVARLSGDEFGLLYEEIATAEEALYISQRVHQVLENPFSVTGHEIFVTASVGIAIGDRHSGDLQQLLTDADTAMYRAKMAGRGRTQVFTGEMRDEVVERLRLETELRQGLERGEFVVFYQPIVALRGRGLNGFEALVRWRHPERGLLYPARFIGIAEETGTILPLGMWVLEEACRQLAAWQAAEPSWRELSVSVNLSPRLFGQPDLVPRVSAILERTGLAPASLKLEITEGLLIEDPEEAGRMLQELREMGVGICLDDFGTGYSSLSYLNRFAVDVLKIDRSFIRELGQGGDKVELVRNIVRLAADLGLTVVAEGVETTEQRTALVELDCELMQGFEFSRPIPAAEIWQLFHSTPG